jgi:CDP-glucose 4,6-dehydratase
MTLFNNIYKNKRVLVTGHTGFKGSWMVYWLNDLGADLYGLSLETKNSDDHFNHLQLPIKHELHDIRDSKFVEEYIKRIQPEIIFHLAAQAIVSESYLNPIENYEVNLIGTLNIYEAARKTNSVKAIVSITTDKVYKNNDLEEYFFKENDFIGGKDPYSSSKSCVEILSDSYRYSYLENSYLLATVRAGNVIGGGDWGEGRLIPDIMKALIKSKTSKIRNPESIRPWQNVLESISGYLCLGNELLNEKKEFASSWNFGPNKSDHLSVSSLLKIMKKGWEKIEFKETKQTQFKESKLLMLDSSKAKNKLKWRPVWNVNKNIYHTINWYKNYIETREIITEKVLKEYINDAKKTGLIWTSK